jgi:hypothetical protein
VSFERYPLITLGVTLDVGSYERFPLVILVLASALLVDGCLSCIDAADAADDGSGESWSIPVSVYGLVGTR